MNSDDDLELTADFAVPEGDTPLGAVARTMLNGTQLATGLRASADETLSRRDRHALLFIANAIENGTPVEEALTKGHAVSPYMRSMLIAGIQSGQLPRVLGEYLSVSRSQRNSMRELWLTGLYPLVILLVMVFVASVFLSYILPQMKDIFSNFGVELPRLTLFVITLSDGLAAYWWVFAAVLVVSLFLLGVNWRQRLFRLIPLLGTAASLLDLSELCVMLALLIRARLPLDSVFETLSLTLQNRRLRLGCHAVAADLTRGASLPDIIFEQRIIPAQILQLLTHSSQPDALAEQLHLLGRTYAIQAQMKQRQGLVVIEPLFLVLCASCGGIFIIAMFMPLVKLLNDLS